MLVIPGLAVHAYAEPPVQHLRDNGYHAKLLSPPAWRGVDHDLERYGRHLARLVLVSPTLDPGHGQPWCVGLCGDTADDPSSGSA